MNWDDSQPIMDATGLRMLKQRRARRAGLLVRTFIFDIGLGILILAILLTVLHFTGHFDIAITHIAERGPSYWLMVAKLQ